MRMTIVKFTSQNKVFVYRGLEYERVETFTQRMQTEFPSAQILTKNSPPSHAILQSDSQCKNFTVIDIYIFFFVFCVYNVFIIQIFKYAM